jgi:predicted DNA-binding transcriptional regulator YafY
MNQFDRIFQLHRLLSGRRRGRSFDELQLELDCSRSSLRRAIDYLRDSLGAPLVHDRERGGYLYDGDSLYELPGLWFSAQELSALLVLEEVVASQPLGLLAETLRPFRERMEKLAQQSGIGLPAWRSRLRLLRMAARTPGSQFANVAEALARRRRIRIDYHARSDDRMAPRIVSPQRLTLYRDNWYLDAWCHRRDALRVFAVERIIAAEPLDEPAQDIGAAALDEILATSYGIFAGAPTATAVLRFSPHAARWIAAEIWHPQQQDERTEEGDLIRRIPFYRSEELVMDVLRQGADVEVLEPAGLRDEVIRRLQDALNIYTTHASTGVQPANRERTGIGTSR